MHLKLGVSSNVCNLRQICISGFPAIAGMSCFEVSNSKFVLFIFSPPKPRWYLCFTVSWTGGRNGAEDNSTGACRFQSLLSAGARSRSGKLSAPFGAPAGHYSNSHLVRWCGNDWHRCCVHVKFSGWNRFAYGTTSRWFNVS